MIQRFIFVAVTLLGSLVTRQAILDNPIFTAYPVNDVLGNLLVIIVFGLSIIVMMGGD